MDALTMYSNDVIMNSYASQLHDIIAPYCTASRVNVWSKIVSSSRYFAFDAIYNRYHTFAGNIQKIAREVRTIMGFDDEFSFYTARDSWASIMSSEYQMGQAYLADGAVIKNDMTPEYVEMIDEDTPAPAPQIEAPAEVTAKQIRKEAKKAAAAADDIF